jgi:hypothetical protein
VHGGHRLPLDGIHVFPTARKVRGLHANAHFRWRFRVPAPIVALPADHDEDDLWEF